MQTFCRRAIVASALPEEAAAMRRMLEDAGVSEVTCVFDGLSAVRCAQEAPTDVIVADAVLPVLDGGAMMQRISALALNVYPAVILLAAKGMCPVPHMCAMEKPVGAQQLIEEIGRLQPQHRDVPEEKRARARELLGQIGIPQHCGGEYLLRAIEIVWLDSRLIKSLSAKVYPAVAEHFGANEKHIPRAMRHVIDAAWRDGEMEMQYKLFGDTIDAKRGSPTLSEMIARIADILRWEGKA